jgi:hypothetical protein
MEDLATKKTFPSQENREYPPDNYINLFVLSDRNIN